MKKNEQYLESCGGIKAPNLDYPMNNDTELIFIIDRSGSMSGFEGDTIGGFNSTIEKQKKGDGKVYVSTVLFDNKSELIHDRVAIDKIAPMTVEDYQVGGCTALLDAIGGAICHIADVHKYIRPEDVPAHTIFVITTDGMENASSTYTTTRVKEMIKKQTKKCGWEFIFLAANIDAIGTAGHIGIRADRAAKYTQSSDGFGACYDAVNTFCSMSRSCIIKDNPTGIGADWKKSLEENEKCIENNK